MRTIGDIARLSAKRYPNKTAIIMDDKSLTFSQLNRLSNQLAYGLLSLGVSKGDRVGLLAHNCIEYAIVNYAVAKCGAILVPVNFRFKESELAYVVNNSEHKVLFFGEEFASLVGNTIPSFNTRPTLIPIDGPPMEEGHTMYTLLEGQSTADPAIEMDPLGPAAVIYTAGTTGFPKGVLASNESILGTNLGLIVEGDLGHDDVVLCPLPLFHSGGINMLLQPPLEMGATVVLMGAGFDPDKFLTMIEKYGITHTMCVPTQLAMLVNQAGARNYDLSTFQKMWYGSSVISPTVLDAARDLFKCRFYQFYGQTEAGICLCLRPEDHADHGYCTGREIFHADVRVVDEDGQDTPVGEVGEIIGAYRPLGMIGFYGNEEATRHAMRDGWIHTEDLARVEGGGYLTIVDRLRDMIISGGENIYSKEIEDIILTDERVREVAVFGIPDEVYGESVCAVVVKKEGVHLEEQDVIDFCATKISGYKKPKKIDFVDELPKNPTGKVTKGPLRAPYWADRKRRV